MEISSWRAGKWTCAILRTAGPCYILYILNVLHEIKYNGLCTSRTKRTHCYVAVYDLENGEHMFRSVSTQRRLRYGNMNDKAPQLSMIRLARWYVDN